ncbi:hypothetical protein H2200_011988 [Cladophialophora chaetospira]|uniref:Uncharacterized protein n=1 Tax=Cladophialophora chaetospira TaxID=386627 RepID=A0AA39CD43_9EURO|nr:hypothetical protein H2200_011988 [Cladophialophora chaetospira]
MAPESELVFIVTTPRHGGGSHGSSFLSEINAHVAHHMHAERRAKSASSGSCWQLTAASQGLQFSSKNPIEPVSTRKSHSSKSGRGRRRRKKTNESGLPSDVPFLSALDPFLWLPIALSDREKNLLQYFLREGRCLTPGTSTNPRQCVSMRSMRQWMQQTPLCVLGRLMETDHILSKLAGKEPPLTYYKQRARVLRGVKAILAAKGSQFAEKLYAMMELTWTGYTTNSPDLPMHMNAIDALIESHGGISAFLLPQSGLQVQPTWIVGMFGVIEFQITSYSSLALIRDRFILTLKRIRSWACDLEALCDADRSSQRKKLEKLASFLHEPIAQASLPADLPFPMAMAPFFCCYSLCMTCVENDFDIAGALDYFHRVQQKLPMIENGCSRGGTALAHMLADARLEISPESYTRRGPIVANHTEIRICQASVDASKIFSLLPEMTRWILTKVLYDAVFTFAGAVDLQALLPDNNLECLKADIDIRWWRRQPLTAHRDGTGSPPMTNMYI